MIAGACSDDTSFSSVPRGTPPEAVALVRAGAVLTYFNGHIDGYTAHPKDTVPDYARSVLEPAGHEVRAVLQPRVPTTGLDEPTDHTIPAEQDTTWYPQEGQAVAKDVLLAFLRIHADAFEIPVEAIDAGLPSLELVKYGVGRYFRRTVFRQSLGEYPVLDSKTVVLFDLNWNVVVISRQIYTPNKIVPRNEVRLDEAEALALARSAIDTTSKPHELRVTSQHLGVDVIRGLMAWEINLTDEGTRNQYTVTIDAGTAEVFNVSDNSARLDADVLRWDYQSANFKSPVQSTEYNVYTRSSNSLEHDFFFMANDNRNNGGTQSTCFLTDAQSDWTPGAYGTNNSSTWIRPTLRGDRNFTLWQPSAPKGSFGESHIYWWAREYMQWQKQSLVDLGVLTLGHINNYTRALIILNACEDGGGRFTSSFDVTTLNSAGEGLGTIIFPEFCRTGNYWCTLSPLPDSSYLTTYESDGGYSTPGVIAHELNHFVLIDYFGVSNSIDCSADKELKYFQEGGLGRTLPQMFWQATYGSISVPYLPSSQWQLFRSSGASGEPHDPSDSTSFHTISDFPCDDDASPYASGAPVAQPLWEIYNGEKVIGSTQSNMGKPAADTGMITSMYYAADLAAASTDKDRQEFASRFMEFWDLFSTASATTKGNWCDVWSDHGMTSVPAVYCL